MMTGLCVAFVGDRKGERQERKLALKLPATLSLRNSKVYAPLGKKFSQPGGRHGRKLALKLPAALLAEFLRVGKNSVRQGEGRKKTSVKVARYLPCGIRRCTCASGKMSAISPSRERGLCSPVLPIVLRPPVLSILVQNFTLHFRGSGVR